MVNYYASSDLCLLFVIPFTINEDVRQHAAVKIYSSQLSPGSALSANVSARIRKKFPPNCSILYTRKGIMA